MAEQCSGRMGPLPRRACWLTLMNKRQCIHHQFCGFLFFLKKHFRKHGVFCGLITTEGKKVSANISWKSVFISKKFQSRWLWRWLWKPSGQYLGFFNRTIVGHSLHERFQAVSCVQCHSRLQINLVFQKQDEWQKFSG